jgi:RNA polymerase sigma factor, sigma-70 family
LSDLYNEKDWVAHIAAGDQSAFSHLFNQYQDRLMYFVTRFPLTRQEAEDVVAESFLKAWQSRTTFSSESHIRNFLYLTAKNSAINLVQFKERQKDYLEKYGAMAEEGQDRFDYNRVETEMLHLMHRAMEQLPDECRKIFRLYLQDLSPKEIAAQLSISPATVRSQKRRAILLMQEWFKVHLLSIIALLCVSGAGWYFIKYVNFFFAVLHILIIVFVFI